MATKFRYSDIITAEAPIARARYFQNQNYKLQQDALAQDAAQFNTSLDLSKKAIEESRNQANVANTIAGAGLATEAYPYLKSGVGKVAGLFGGSEAAAVPAGYTAGESALVGASPYTTPAYDYLLAESAAPTGAGEAALAGESGGSAASGSTAAAPLGYILAAIAAQKGLSNATDTVFEGQPTGDVFTTTNGQWTPRFGNEPWHGYLNSRLGLGPSAGERFDAALANQDYAKAGLRTPALVNQWADPIGDAGYDVITGGVKNITGSEKAGDVAGALLNPVGATADKIGSADNIGDVASAILDPAGIFTGGTHFCTAIAKSVGMSKIQTAMMTIFRNWCLENYKEITEHYLKFGGDLVDTIKESVDEMEYFADLKKIVVDKVLELMAKDDIQSAYETYRQKYLELLKEYTPENLPWFAKAEIPGV